MTRVLRKRILDSAQTIVVKVGTNVLSDANDRLDEARINALAEQLHEISNGGRRVVLVSSGAIGAGMTLLGMKTRPKDLRYLQASAATGQAQLIQRYEDALRPRGYHAAQLLLTANDFKNRARYLNVRNTLLTLQEYPVIPVVNENDTVSVDEIKLGDNDRLAAMVANLLPADLLIVLSVVDGLLSGDPSDPKSQLIPIVESFNDQLMELAGASRSSRGTGGMKTKLEAVRTATSVGTHVVLAHGKREGVLRDILAGEEIGTLFVAERAAVPAWKRWIGYTMPPKGKLHLDDGASKAVRDQGKSLLPIGVSKVDGDFGKGEVVSLIDASGREFARGLTNYDAQSARNIVGRRTEEISRLLGAAPYDEMIHRDNLVVID